MPQEIDPWSPELAALLKTLTPEAELIYRLALQGEFPRLQGRQDWALRTSELMSQVLTTREAWDRILAAVKRKEAELFEAPANAPAATSRRSRGG